MDEIKDMLGQEIKAEIESLSELNPGSEEKTAAIEDLTKLYRLWIDESKVEQESTCEGDQLAEQMKDRYIKLGMDIANLVLPLICYGVWMNKGFKFEETGSFTSTTFRGLFSRFRPTKK